MNSEKFQNFHFQAEIVIFSDFSEFTPNMIFAMRIHPCYHFCDFLSKMRISA